MTLSRKVPSALFLAVSIVTLGACSSSSAGPSSESQKQTGGDAGGTTPDAAAPDAASPVADSGGSPVDAFNGDCSTARWTNVSDECWACLCNACKPKLDACNQDCTDVFQCAQAKHTLVNKGTELTCEITATTALCLADPKSQAVAQPLLDFDTCLLTATKTHAGDFRACDTECRTAYSGDVCTRVPPPKM